MTCSSTPGVGVGDPAQKIDELDVGVLWVEGVRTESAREDLEGGEQGGGAVALIVVGLLQRVRRGQRLVRAGAGQGLDLGFLIDAHHHGIFRRGHVQAHHVPELGLQGGVGGELERLDPVRLNFPTPPDPGHGRK